MVSLKNELKAVFVSAVPIISLVTVLLLAFVAADVLTELTFFLFCVVLVILGIATFLIGVEIGILPASHSVGAEIPGRGSILFLFVIVFTISFLVTVADPDVSIFADLAHGVFPVVNTTQLIVVISAGVAFMLVFSALRIVYNFSQRLLFFLGYGVIVVLAFFVPPEFFGMSFDAGGVSTGPINIPVLIALGVGLCSVLSSRTEMDGFGLVGMATIGPIVGVMIYSILTGGSGTGVMTPVTYSFTLEFLLNNLVTVISQVAIALIPLTVFFVVFQRVFMKYPLAAMKVMLIGIGLAAVGMILFLTGVNSGFLPVASDVGKGIAELDAVFIAAIGFAIGFLVTFAEPAVKIMSVQVEEASHGVLKSKMLVTVLALGVASFVAVGMAMTALKVPLIYAVVPGYILALILMMFSERDLVGVAFDSGGVATGPMAVTLIMTMYTGLAAGMYGADAAAGSFGIIILMVLAPILFVLTLGVILKIFKGKGVRSDENDIYE